MSKTKVRVQHKNEEGFSDAFTDFSFPCSTSEIIHTLVEANNYQNSFALELTKLITGSLSDEKKTEESIINTFVLASKTVRENSAVNSILKKFVPS